MAFSTCRMRVYAFGLGVALLSLACWLATVSSSCPARTCSVLWGSAPMDSDA